MLTVAGKAAGVGGGLEYVTAADALARKQSAAMHEICARLKYDPAPARPLLLPALLPGAAGGGGGIPEEAAPPVDAAAAVLLLLPSAWARFSFRAEYKDGLSREVRTRRRRERWE